MVALIAMVGAILAPHARAAEASTPPAPVSSAAPKTMCESLADLRLYVGFLRDQSLHDDGLVPVLVGVVASLEEARTLAGLVGQEYRPLVDDLIEALRDLGSSVRGFREAGTIGSGLVQLGEAIARVGVTLDVLSGALREPCPLESPAPTTMPQPAPSAAA